MTTSPTPARTPFGSPLRLAAALAGLVALLLALGQTARVFADMRDRERQVGELLATSDRERRASRFHEAWAALSDAGTVVREAGPFWRLTGRAETQRLGVQTAREDLAMAWLRTWLLSTPSRARSSSPVDTNFPDPSPNAEGGIFSIEGAVGPVLADGAARAEGRRKADLLAHLGWEAYRHSLLGGITPPEMADPERFFKQAIETDPSNPYAHAYWGHILATRKSLPEAQSRFEAALASGRARSFVRSVQLAALRANGTRAGDIATIDAVANMVRNHEPVTDATRGQVSFLYAISFDRDGAFAQLGAAVPPTEQIALIRTLFLDVPDRRPDPKAYAWMARLQEAAGDHEGALDSWRAVLAALPPDDPGLVAGRARAAIAARGPALLR